MRMRAEQFKRGEISGFTLANSVLKHTEEIAGDEE